MATLVGNPMRANCQQLQSISAKPKFWERSDQNHRQRRKS